MEKYRWLKPRLVATIDYLERTVANYPATRDVVVQEIRAERLVGAPGKLIKRFDGRATMLDHVSVG
jgi:hypothetical protein